MWLSNYQINIVSAVVLNIVAFLFKNLNWKKKSIMTKKFITKLI